MNTKSDVSSAVHNSIGIDSIAVEMQGLWLQKNEAEELRATGKLNSICEMVKTDPNTSIMNVRLVAANGTTYIYHPIVEKSEELKIGVIAASGDFTPTPFFKQISGNSTVHVSVADDVLSFSFKEGQNEATINYLRSSTTEARQYFDAQEAYKKQ